MQAHTCASIDLQGYPRTYKCTCIPMCACSQWNLHTHAPVHTHLKSHLTHCPPPTSLNVMCRFIFTHVPLCTHEPPYACSHTGAQGCVIYKHTVTYTMSIHLYTHKCLHIQGCTFMQVAAHTLARIHGGSHTGLCTPMHT